MQLGTIKGIVMDVNTKDPVKGALVEIEKTKINCVTDDSGKYSLTNFPGSHVIEITKEGYKKTTRTVFIDGTVVTNEDILLSQDPAIATKVAGRKPVLLVIDYYSDELLIFNLGNNTIIKKIPLGQGGEAIAFSPDKRNAYIALAGNNSVMIIDLINNFEITGYVNVGKKPRSLVATKYNLYVVNSGSNDVSVIDLNSCEAYKTIKAGKMPVKIIVDENEEFAYIFNSMSNNVSVINCNTSSLSYNITADKFPVTGAVSSEYLYIVNQIAQNLTIIDLNTKKKTDELKPGGVPKSCLYIPGENKLYVANYQDDNIAVIDGNNGKIIKKINTIGSKPLGMSLYKSRKMLYVANSGSGTISVIDVVTDDVILEFSAGKFPYELSIIE
jgi:YVTN family beta-propeller protein